MCKENYAQFQYPSYWQTSERVESPHQITQPGEHIMTNKELDELRLKFITARLEGKVIQHINGTEWRDLDKYSTTPLFDPFNCRIKPAEVVYVVMNGPDIDEIFKDRSPAFNWLRSQKIKYIHAKIHIDEYEIK